MKLRHLRAWAAKIQNPVVVSLVPFMASVTGAILDALVGMRDRPGRFYCGRVPALAEWLALYESPKPMLAGIVELLAQVTERMGCPDDAIFLRALLTPKTPEQRLEEGFGPLRGKTPEEAGDMFRAGAADLRESGLALLEDEEPDDTPLEDVKAFLAPPEIQFVVRVCLPCCYRFQTLPWALFKAAADGDAKAANSLFSVDQAVMGNAKIAAVIAQSRLEEWNPRVRGRKREPDARDRRRITRKQVMYMVGGFISAVSDFYGSRLTEPEIRGIFLALAKDLGGEHEETLAALDEGGFQKAIQRHRRFWAREVLGPFAPALMAWNPKRRERVDAIVRLLEGGAPVNVKGFTVPPKTAKAKSM